MTYTINAENYISDRDALFANFPYIYNVEDSEALDYAFEASHPDHGYKYVWEALIQDFRDWIDASDADFAFFDGEREVEFLVGFKNAEDAKSFADQFEVITVQEPLLSVQFQVLSPDTKASATLTLVK